MLFSVAKSLGHLEAKINMEFLDLNGGCETFFADTCCFKANQKILMIQALLVHAFNFLALLKATRYRINPFADKTSKIISMGATSHVRGLVCHI